MTEESPHPIADAVEWLVACEHRTISNHDRILARQAVDDAISRLVDARIEKLSLSDAVAAAQRESSVYRNRAEAAEQAVAILMNVESIVKHLDKRLSALEGERNERRGGEE